MKKEKNKAINKGEFIPKNKKINLKKGEIFERSHQTLEVEDGRFLLNEK